MRTGRAFERQQAFIIIMSMMTALIIVDDYAGYDDYDGYNGHDDYDDYTCWWPLGGLLVVLRGLLGCPWGPLGGLLRAS